MSEDPALLRRAVAAGLRVSASMKETFNTLRKWHKNQLKRKAAMPCGK